MILINIVFRISILKCVVTCTNGKIIIQHYNQFILLPQLELWEGVHAKQGENADEPSKNTRNQHQESEIKIRSGAKDLSAYSAASRRNITYERLRYHIHINGMV